MRSASLLLLLLASCGPENATGPTWRDKPPARYQGNTTAVVAFASPNVIRAMCPSVPNAVGCYAGGVIYLPNPCGWDDAYAVLACHELGHRNGWPADHTP